MSKALPKSNLPVIILVAVSTILLLVCLWLIKKNVENLDNNISYLIEIISKKNEHPITILNQENIEHENKKETPEEMTKINEKKTEDLDTIDEENTTT